MSKEFVELLLRLFTPSGAVVVALILGVFTALYTAIIKFLFEKKLKKFENNHALELARLQGRLAAENQVMVQNLQDQNNRALKELEAELTRRTQEELQKSQAVLTEEQAQKQSRRDYEYEARKRLYHECEPLVFELLEFAENAGDRIRGLARTARHGNLPQWLVGDGYYMASTMYYLLAPVAVYKLMRRRLTAVDMTLDQSVATHYRLAKQVAWSFADDFSFAWGLRIFELDYDPNNQEWERLRVADEAKYWRQGIPYGRLDNAVESLIIRDHEPDGNLRIMSFGEFESALHKAGSVSETFTIVRDIFTDFHPARRPVLWRMLVAQAHIYMSIVRFHHGDRVGRNLVITPISAHDRDLFSWERPPIPANQQKMDEAFAVAETYFKKNIPTLWST